MTREQIDKYKNDESMRGLVELAEVLQNAIMEEALDYFLAAGREAQLEMLSPSIVNTYRYEHEGSTPGASTYLALINAKKEKGKKENGKKAADESK